ncbi:hypothetical protein IG631_13435 [Alternaria alternata]|nr:hypothetical protein IG631_13435 [Alternaria alternata]
MSLRLSKHDVGIASFASRPPSHMLDNCRSPALQPMPSATNLRDNNFFDNSTTTPCLKCRMRSGGSTR